LGTLLSDSDKFVGINMVNGGFDFEQPIIELERQIEELTKSSSGENSTVSREIQNLRKKAKKIKREIYTHLTPWQRVQIARHPHRPYTFDYINLMMEDFLELHGDRNFADDRAIVGGLARLDGRPVVVIGQQKGKDTKENILRNFGQPHPEGYRKALRIMKLAERFSKPIISFLDATGAYCGIGAEERGQGEAIARNLHEMASLRVPIIVIITGEGGSGGALALGVGDRILMLENSYYSVCSPEACAAILWRDRNRAPEAAEALCLTAQDLLQLGIIDEIVKEPLGGAHNDYQEIAGTLKKAIMQNLDSLCEIPIDELLQQRYIKFRQMGVPKEICLKRIRKLKKDEKESSISDEDS